MKIFVMLPVALLLAAPLMMPWELLQQAWALRLLSQVHPAAGVQF
ncbi:hypothetical protein [Mesorhizobium sp. Root157]|nr:hypothetical protein [Mesorhizobium sp. Root157]